jgi:DNA segregation ATPase FtsK/SpoIIIE-like protein
MLTYNPTLKTPAEHDDIYDEAVKMVADTGLASATLIQRHFKIGYARAARLLDELEEGGIVGPVNGAKPREILVTHKDQNGQTIVPKKEPEAIKVEFEDTLAKWKKTKYAENRSDAFEIELGVDENNKKVCLDLDKYGNLLVIGSQFTSVNYLLNSVLAESLSKYSPEELRLIVIDGLRDDIVLPNQASHLLTPVIIEPEKSISALKWSVAEIERRSKLESQDNSPKVLVLINSLNQISYFSPSELEYSLYQIIVRGRKYGFYLIMGTDYPNPRTSKELVANSPTRLVFKPTDKKVARETGIPESIDLVSPDEAILETMYEGKRKITIKQTNQKKIYEEIFG